MSGLVEGIVSAAIPVGVGVGIGLLATRLIRRLKISPLDRFCPREINNYVERDFFDIQIASEIMISKKKQYVFLGPKGCGKSTSLYKLYYTLKSTINYVVFIDLKQGLTDENMMILNHWAGNIIFLIDNAQLLDNQKFIHLKALMYSYICQSSVLVYSQFIVPQSGSLPEFLSGHSQIIWFRPFSLKEVETYLIDYDHEVAVQAYSETCGIPHLVSLYKGNLEDCPNDIFASMCFLVYFSVTRLEKIGYTGGLIGDLCYVALGFPPEVSSKEMLRFLGFIYYDQSQKICLTYPPHALRIVLYNSIDMLTRLVSVYARGPELELKFSMLAQSIPLVFISKNAQIDLPKATEFIIQQKEWEIPTLQPGECSIIKCALNHIAIDFIIVNDIHMAEDAKYIMLVQVSHQYYQHRGKCKRHCSIHTSQTTPSGKKSTSQYYRNAFGINCKEKAYYCYVSTETSINNSIFDNEKVYHSGI